MRPRSTPSQERTTHRGTVTVPATIVSRASAVDSVPVMAGVCLPMGTLNDVAHASIHRVHRGDDSCVSTRSPDARDMWSTHAVQCDVVNRWPDGSVKWVLVSCVAPRLDADRTAIEIRVDRTASSGPALDDQRTSVRWQSDQVHITTQVLDASLPSERSWSLTPQFHDSHGRLLAFELEQIQEELAGVVRQVFRVSLKCRDLPFLRLQLRFTHWTQIGFWEIESRLRNTRRAVHHGGLWDLGDPGSLCFRNLEFAVQIDGSASAAARWSLDAGQTLRSAGKLVRVRQSGSGGRNWHSSNHVDADGVVPVHDRGFTATDSTGTLRGLRADPLVVQPCDEFDCLIAVPEFWQNFPATLAVGAGRVLFAPFPEMPASVAPLYAQPQSSCIEDARRANDADGLAQFAVHELQGGEQKTHTIFVQFTSHTPPAADTPDASTASRRDAAWMFDRPRLVQSPESVAASRALPWFCVPTDPSPVSSRFNTWRDDVLSGGNSLAERRESIDEYGWRNYGDVPASHEQLHYTGPNRVVSHYNNQFDVVYGGILQWLATGNLTWPDLFDPLARHVMDIDLYHTAQDRAAFSGGLFWHTDHYVDARTSTHRTYSRTNQRAGQPYGGGPSCEHNYTTGLLHYYFLTGNPEARDSVLSLADWVLRMDDGRLTVFGLLDNGPTGGATQTVTADFHGPGRGAGNSINALLDAWLLTGSQHYLTKLEELVRRCVHPRQDPAALHLLDAEGHWSYTVFLTALGRYLLAMRDAGLLTESYSYARAVMETYGRWMAAYEGRTLDHPDRLQYPTEAWAAQDVRKANVLRVAAACESADEDAAAMRAKADAISDAAWNDLHAFGDARFNARCLAILLTEGHREVTHRTTRPDQLPPGPAVDEFGSWSMFVPQKQRVKHLLKSPRHLIPAVLNAFHPTRIREFLTALRKHR